VRPPAHDELAEQLAPHNLSEIRAIYKEEGQRLLAAARGLGLVDRAMKGEKLTPKSADPAPWFPQGSWLGG
jgi:hypothetical protein